MEVKHFNRIEVIQQCSELIFTHGSNDYQRWAFFRYKSDKLRELLQNCIIYENKTKNVIKTGFTVISDPGGPRRRKNKY